MRKVIEILGWLLLIEGVAGLIHEWIGWFRYWVLVPYLDFLKGYEIWANIGLIVLGVIVMSLAGSGKK